MKEQNINLNSTLKLICSVAIIFFIIDFTTVFLQEYSGGVAIFAHILNVVLILLFLKEHKVALNSIISLKQNDIFLLIHCFCIGVVVCSLSSCLENVMMLFYSERESIYSVSNNSNDIYCTVFSFLFSVSSGPIIEEIEYRMLLFSGILQRTSNLILAVVISSFFFMIIHTGTVHIGALILGIISSIIYYFSKRIICSIMIHFSYNLVPALLWLSFGNSEGVENEEVIVEEVISYSDIVFNATVSIVLGCFLLVILIAMMIIAYVRMKNLKYEKVAINKENNITKNQKRETRILLSLYIVICVMGWIVLGKRG